MKLSDKYGGIQFFAPDPPLPVKPGFGPFYNYFYLDGVLEETIMSSDTVSAENPEGVTSLWIVYKNNNIYGLTQKAEPTAQYILTNGSIILSNVNAEYTGYFYENHHYDYNTESGYLVEDEVVKAGYFANFTTYHTTKSGGQ